MIAITAYDRTSWEAVLSAFHAFLDNRQTHSRLHKSLADKALAKRQLAIAAYRQEYNRLNPHFSGKGDYCQTRLPMKKAKNIVALSSRQNGDLQQKAA